MESLLEQSIAGEHTSAHVKERAHLHLCIQEEDRLQCDRAHTACDRAHLCVKTNLAAALFWKFCFIRVWLILVAQELNPMIFRI